MKIEPKYEDGEPICAMYVDCPFYDFNHDIQDHCTKLANEAVYDGSPCIPALRRDRDQAIKERDELDTAFQSEWGKRKELESQLEKRLTVSFVGMIPKKYDDEGVSGLYQRKKKHIFVNIDEPVSTLIHEVGHYVIDECGGDTPEHDLYDYLDCEGQSFVDFANQVETLEIERNEALAREKALQREICGHLWAVRYNRNQTIKEVAENRGWPDIFEGGE